MTHELVYPMTSLTATTAALGTNTILPGNLTYIPMAMASNGTKITIIQNSAAQDRSLDIWVSSAPGGQAIQPYISLTQGNGNVVHQNMPNLDWHAFRDASNPFVLFTATAGHGTIANFSAAAGVFYVLVPDGTCYINILNLVDQANSFTFAQATP